MSVAPLCGRDGALVSVSVCVDPRHLESLLEALAEVGFPINPQIYHDAALVYRFPDDREVTESTTLVEFPAYEGRLDEVSSALAAFGFDRSALRVHGMLDEIQANPALDPAPAGAPYLGTYRIKRRAAAAR
jgi:hypothetical protein